MSISLRADHDRWVAEKDNYENLWQRVVQILKQELRGRGLFAQVTGRTKDTASLLKKLLKKGYAYEMVTDKAGARVVVRFRHETPIVLDVIETSFDVLCKEDKAEALGHNQVGYTGIHYDVRLKNGTLRMGDASLAALQCEIQVHTMCQDLWALMDHEFSYKPVLPIPEDLRRQIYLLNALLEIADKNFAAISQDIANLPGAYAMGLLQTLERHFYRLAGEDYDRELTQQVFEQLKSLYDGAELAELPQLIDRFVDANGSKLQSIFDQYRDIEDRPIFLFQPEAILILERVKHDPHVLEETWVSRYPREELERLCIAWGEPLD